MNQAGNSDLKQKRIRHLDGLIAKNLHIDSNRFKIWFTLHLNRNSNAFYISDKKENDRNPKWSLANIPKLPNQEFLIRIWYKNVDETANLDRRVVRQEIRPVSNNQQKDVKLCLLIEMEVNMNYLIYLSEVNLTYSIQNYENFLMFEIFDNLFTEPLFSLKNERITPSLQRIHENSKNSYTLNLMIRLHDFQRVIYETKRKISYLKTTSLGKFENSSRLRQLQRNRELKMQKLVLLRENSAELNKSISNLIDTNLKLKESVQIKKERIRKLTDDFHADKQKYSSLEKSLENAVNSNFLLKNQLIFRQKQLVRDLAYIFNIQKLETIYNSYNSSSNLNRLSVENGSLATTKSNPVKLKILNSCLRLAPLSNNSINSSSNFDRENSIAIGYIAHAVQLLSNIFCISLRFPVVYKASRSYIIEQFNEKDVRMLALFKQASIQDDHFIHAVNLLNSDIIQMRIIFDNYKNIDNSDLLLNLKWIFDYFKS